MEKAKWTNDQNEAINDFGCNILVAAGAGAGKTAVLVERIIQKLINVDHPVDIDKLLVVTFTNAAAAEMRERIGDAITREIEKDNESKQLQRQLTLLSRANVMTIHSFCLGVIRTNFHLLDIDPNFRVCDETEAVLLKDEIMEELFEDCFQKDDTGFINLVKAFGEKDDRRVQGIILNLYRFAVSTPWPKDWLTKIAEDYNVDENFDFSTTKWCSIIMEDILIELEGAINRFDKAINLIKDVQGLKTYYEFLEKEASTIRPLLLSSSFKDLSESFSNVSFERLPSKKLEGYDKELRDKIKDIRDEVKKKIQGISSEIFGYHLENNKTIVDMYPILKTLSRVTIEFQDRFSSKKREKGIIDFNDIEHFALEILCRDGEPSETALGYRKIFEEILIDEYQDSNLVQEVIMDMISRKNPGNVFMVGDVKQSIYRFRHAKPELFLKKYNEYGRAICEPGKKIKLFKNFRSRNEIIEGVNFVFKQLMSDKLGELNYNQEEVLETGATYPDYERCIELNIMDKEVGEEEDSDLEQEDMDSIQMEARMTGKRLLELMDSDFQVFDKESKAMRKICFKDMVILMRTTQKWSQVFTDELSIMKIPVFADTSTGYFETTEIKTIMCLLQVMDNPIQDIPLVAVMRSPIFSFTPEELIDIRTVDKKMSFYEICKTGKIENFELKEKVDLFLEKLSNWRNKGLYIPVDEFIWYLYSQTGYYSFVGTMPQGIQRQANLRLLFQRAREYEKTSYKGLFNFINFINKLKISSGDMGSAKVLGENENVVRIMSIHKSKGLEFPVVFLCGTGKKFNMMDANQSILFHQELGYGSDYVDYERRISYPTLIKQIVKKKIKTETLSEEMRILYVAFTRAKEKLIITGVVKDIRKNSEKWCSGVDISKEKLSSYYLLNSKCFLDWLGAAVVRNKGGDLIRELGEFEEFSGDDNGRWNIRMWNKYEVIQEKTSEDEAEIEVTDFKFEIKDPAIYDEVKRKLEWGYKFSSLGNIPAKISVSELKSEGIKQPVVLKKPGFLEKSKRITGAEKGTIMHLVMQHLDLTKVDSESIMEQVAQMVKDEFLSAEEADQVSIKKISGFFKTPLGLRMMSADYIKREAPFFIKLNVKDVYPEIKFDEEIDETILLQGVIDCYFEEKGEIILLDYKTDYVDDSEKIAFKYKKQVELYADALEKITGKTVREKYIYLFSSSEIVKI